jgi:hypothetical protein
VNRFIRNLGSTLTLFAAAVVVTMPLLADETDSKTSDETDAYKRIDYDIKFLASDDLEGRGVETKGIKVAADYIANEYKKAGLKPGAKDGTYLQEFPVAIRETQDVKKSTLVLTGPDGKMELKAGEEYSAQTIGGSGEGSGELVFIGYSISSDEHNYDELKNVDLEGKIAVFIRNEPQQNDENSVFDGKEASRFASIRTKIRNARVAGAKAIILVNDYSHVSDMNEEKLETSSFFGNGSMQIPFFQVKRSVIDKILAKAPVVTGEGKKLDSLTKIEETIDDTLEPLSQALEGWSANANIEVETKSVPAHNVIGVIEGEGPYADETIIIGGHYDHLGFGGYGSRTPGSKEIHNGADDNATGTAAVIELARRFAKSEKKPARRLVFICFSGEERGLVGSSYYCDYPTVELEKIVAMINYDMIGWLRDKKLTVYGSGTAKQFDSLLDSANEKFELALQKQPSPFAGSDHMPFSRKEIPVMFLHSGLTDTYHTPEDDYETLNIKGAVEVIDYSEALLWEMASFDGKYEPVNFSRGGNRGGRNRESRPFSGLSLNYDDGENGITVRRVANDSPAAEAGLKEGDVIVDFGGKKITSRSEYTEFIRSKKAGDKVTVKYKRDGEEKTAELTLADR